MGSRDVHFNEYCSEICCLYSLKFASEINEKLAAEVFEKAKRGEDFEELVKQYTDDSFPGIYSMSNFDAEPNMDQGEVPRSKMIKEFGDVSFKLPVNGIGMAEFSPERSKYGWHIIKRLN